MGSCRAIHANFTKRFLTAMRYQIRLPRFVYRRCMQIALTHIGARPSSKDQFEGLVAMYLERCAAHARCQAESFRNEDGLFDWIDRQQRRAPVIVVLLDSRGKQMTSESFAEWLGWQRDNGAQQIVFA